MSPIETVVCLHSNASSSAQWRSLSARLGERYRVIAVDGRGVGTSPPWPEGASARLDDEAALLEPVLATAGERFHLVGHSFGGAVALLVASRNLGRVASVAVYEPTLFSLVAGADPAASPAAGIWHAAGDAAALAAAGGNDAAAARFVDFWTGEGAFAAMPPRRRAVVAAAARDVGRWREAAFAPTLTMAALAAIDVPVLLMTGERSPESSLAVARLLAATLPLVTLTSEPGLGHMGPIEEPARVDARIAEFIERHRGAATGSAGAPKAEPRSAATKAD